MTSDAELQPGSGPNAESIDVWNTILLPKFTRAKKTSHVIPKARHVVPKARHDVRKARHTFPKAQRVLNPLFCWRLGVLAALPLVLELPSVTRAHMAAQMIET